MPPGNDSMKNSRSGFTINLGSKLAGVALITTIAALLLLAHMTIKEVGIGNETYSGIVDGKDFVADFLPPALYPVEAFADAHVIDGNPLAYAEVAPRIVSNKEAYSQRHTHWQRKFAHSEVMSQTEWSAIDKQFTTLGAKFWEEMESRFLPAAQSKNELAMGASIERLNRVIDDYRSLMRKLTDTVGAKVVAQEAVAVQMAWTDEKELLAIGAGMTVLIAVIVYLAQTLVVNALAKLEVAMRKLAAGELETIVPFISRKDEIGKMAQSLDVFKAMALRDQENKRGLEHVIQVVGGSLAALSRGDLTHRISEPFPEATDRLRISFNAAADELATVIATVKHGADGMKSGTEEIAQASDDLSRRTETQAANLEETAAAVAEIVATVKKTANGAGHARQVVSMAKEEADKSGDVVRKAVDAMNGIEKSSAKINQIIGVIDEIAFQTSLLALNAGVEAARAGDAGRGFAVVAAEVRALAQRSADAAKEIKDLLSTSRTQVEQGVQLVGDTGISLRSIIDRVAEINSVVAEIAAGAEQQSTSLQEVNAAVDQMDQVTQQNAAMVEQATAATRTLTQQSAELAEMVAKFTTVAVTIAEHAGQRKAAKLPLAQRAAPAKPAKIAVNAPDNGNWEEF
jgi:methyl-accepting chemotaxis protein